PHRRRARNGNPDAAASRGGAREPLCRARGERRPRRGDRVLRRGGRDRRKQLASLQQSLVCLVAQRHVRRSDRGYRCGREDRAARAAGAGDSGPDQREDLAAPRDDGEQAMSRPGTLGWLLRRAAAFAVLAAGTAAFESSARETELDPAGVWSCLMYGASGNQRFYLGLAEDGGARMARPAEAHDGQWRDLGQWRRLRDRLEFDDV